MMSLEQVEEHLNFWHFPHEPVEWAIGGLTMHFNLKTLVMSWVTMAIVLLIGILAARGANARKPSKLAVAYESIVDFIGGLAFENMGRDKGATLLTFLVTLFTFLWMGNLLGLIPTLSSPTADVNTTFGLAIMVLVVIQIWGIRYKGLSYFKHFFQPFKVFVILNIVEEIAKPITLAFRLYGNIFAGEILIGVLLGMLGGINYFGGFIPSVIWLGFSLFVGTIQAFVFTMLTIAYVSQVVANDHH